MQVSENPQSKVESKKWLFYAFLAMLCLLGSNFCVSINSTKPGSFKFLYSSSGAVFTGVAYNIYKFVQNHRETGKYWVE